MNGRRPLAAVLALAAGALATLPAGAEPLKLTPGAPLVLACETQSVVLIPSAASTTGEVRLTLEAAPAKSNRPGSWSIAGLSAAHTASFAVRDKDRCAKGCELTLGQNGRMELWSPKKAAPGTLAPAEPLTVVAIDPAALTISATTIIDKDIAAFEKGTCKAVP